MAEPVPSGEPEQKHAFFHEQAEYWKTFLADYLSALSNG
jgi:hypothetical protein